MAVRNESVRLTLIDDFSGNMAKCAAATALLKRELAGVDRAAVKTDGNAKKAAASLDALGVSAGRAGKGMDSVHISTTRTVGDLKRTEKQLDSVSGRIGLLAEAAITLGPALIPLGAVAAPAVAGLAAGMGGLALGAGAVLIAFQGVGDALKAVNQAALEPTAENVEAARVALAGLSPAAARATQAMAALGPTLTGIRDAGAEGFFPGFTESLDVLSSRAPDLERIVGSLGEAVGSMMSDAGKSLSSDEWDEFFDFLATDARDSLVDMGTALGSLTKGMAELWMSMDPLSDMGTGWMKDAAVSFAEWAAGVDETQGFQEFVDYISENGPQLGETLVSIGSAFLQIIEAAAPLGGPTLAMLEAFADVVSAVADSNLGTPIMAGVSALLLLNRALAITTKITGGGVAGAGMLGGIKAVGGGVKQFGADLRTVSGSIVAFGRDSEKVNAASGRLKGNLVGVGKAGAGIGALTLATSGAADSFGLANTATLALAGSMAGPWGTAAGAAVGFAMDLAGGFGSSAAEADKAAAATERLSSYLGLLGANGKATVDSLSLLYQTVGSDNMSALQKMGVDVDDLLTRAGEGSQAAIVEASTAYMDFLSNFDGSILDALKSDGAASFEALNNALVTGVNGHKANVDAAENHARAEGKVADAVSGTTDSLFVAEEAADNFADALGRVDGFLGSRDALRSYEASIDALADKMGATNWDVGTEKGRENLAELDAATADATERFQQLVDAGKHGQAQKFMTRAIADLEDFGQKTPAARGQVDALTGQLRAVDRKYLASLGVTGDLVAIAKARGVQAALDAMRDRTVRINVITAQSSAKRKDMGFVDGKADGGTIGRAAWGTTVPDDGGGYRDFFPFLLAPLEEVISNRAGQADRYRPELKLMNSNAPAHMVAASLMERMGAGRLANGGTTALGSAGFKQMIGGQGTSMMPGLLSALSLTPKPGTVQALNAAIRENTASTKGLSRVSDRLASRRDEIASLGDALRDGVGGKFKSEVFGQQQDPFLSTSTGSLGMLQADGDNFLRQIKLQAKAKSMGMDGAAFSEFAQKASLPEMEALLKQDGFAKKYQGLYDRRERLASRAGNEAADQGFGRQTAVLEKQLEAAKRRERKSERRGKEIRKDLADLKKELRNNGKAVNGAAAKGRKNTRR